MDIPIEKLGALYVIVGISIWVCIGTWSWAFLRKRDGLSVLPVAWRKPVPWRGVDVLLFVFVYIFLSLLIATGKDHFFPSPAVPFQEVAERVEMTEPEATLSGEAAASGKTPSSEKERGHDVALALLQADDPWTIGLCFFIAVIFAPLSEEIIFRMFLQGYFEKIDWRFRTRLKRTQTLLLHADPSVAVQIESQSSFFRRIPWGVLPIIITSLFFALMHFRMAKAVPSIEEIRSSMITLMLAGTLSLIALFLWLRLVRRARLADFGLVPREIPYDIFRGIIAFCAIAVPIYTIQIVASVLVPEAFAPDPIPIFVLAVALGTVWCRTHRLVPSIVMHMSLNATSMGLAWYLLR